MLPSVAALLWCPVAWQFKLVIPQTPVAAPSSFLADWLPPSVTRGAALTLLAGATALAAGAGAAVGGAVGAIDDAGRPVASKTILAAPVTPTTAVPTDGNDAESRRRAVIAAERAPGSATSLLTEAADPGGRKRKILLGE